MENEFPIFVARWPICGLQLVRTTNIEKGLEFAKVTYPKYRQILIQETPFLSLPSVCGQAKLLETEIQP